MIQTWKTYEIIGVFNKFYDIFERAEGMYSSLLISSEKRDLERQKLETFKCKEFIFKNDILNWIESELEYESSQKSEHNKGYFHALKKLKEMIHAPDLNSRSSNEDSLNKD